MLARPSSVVRSAVGVNTHALYTDTPYGAFPTWYSLLKDLGVRLVRDSLPTAYHSWVHPNYATMKADGFHLLGGVAASASPHWMEKATNADLSAALDLVKPGSALDGFLVGLEGPNEPDLGHDAAWASQTHDTVARLRFIARSKGIMVPIVGPAISGAQARADYGVEPNADRGNMHPYPGRSTQASRWPEELAWTRPVYPSPMPFWVSETGKHGAEHTEAELERQVPELILDCLAQPAVERTFLYELIDTYDRGASDPESNFGLLNFDLTPKASYIALRWLLAALGDGGSQRELPGGFSTNTQALAFSASDGTFRLPVWRASGTVGILLGSPAREVRVLYPDRSDLVLGAQGGTFDARRLAVVKVTP